MTQLKHGISKDSNIWTKIQSGLHCEKRKTPETKNLIMMNHLLKQYKWYKKFLCMYVYFG